MLQTAMIILRAMNFKKTLLMPAKVMTPLKGVEKTIFFMEEKEMILSWEMVVRIYYMAVLVMTIYQVMGSYMVTRAMIP